MIKKDLRCGMVVELRNGTKCYYNNKSFIRLDGCGLYYIDLFNYDLTRQYFLDVVKVYKDYTLKELLWQRKEKLKIYEKYNDVVKLISIEKEDVNDIQTLEDNLYQQLKEFGWIEPK